MPNSAAKYSSDFLSPQRMREALIQLAPTLQQLLGECTLSIWYGTGTRLHGALHYIPMNVSIEVLPFFIEDSLEQKIVEPGATDLCIDSPGHELSLLFCHESDLHVDGTNEDLMRRFMQSPNFADIRFYSQAELAEIPRHRLHNHD